jgi:diguanylate cyclase (GGDEF)-like protein
VRAQPSGPTGPLRRGGPILSRARLSLAVKMVFAIVLTLSMLLSLTDVYLGLGLAVVFIVVTIALDYWVYRAVDKLFRRLVRENREAAQAADDEGPDDLHGNLGELMERLMGSLAGQESLEVETVRSDLYRLRSFNNQLIRLGEIAQELNAALPYRETKQKALDLSKQLLSADIVVLVSEAGGAFCLEGVVGCEEGEINAECCGFYSKCPVRSSTRNRTPVTTANHECRMFPRTMRAQLSLPFTLDGTTTLALLAAAAQPGSFDVISPVVTSTLVGHIQTSLAAAQKYDRIRREVVTDPLTSLYNRRFFERRAEEEVSRSLRHQLPLSLLMLDVDHFKDVNDTYGHQTGDKVLQAVAKFLSDSVRKTDICGRYGGEEFVLLLPNTPGRNATFLANRLRSDLAEIIYTGLGIPSDITITVSGGVATCPRDATTLETLIASADEALYAAKDAGRNRIVQAGIPGLD